MRAAVLDVIADNRSPGDTETCSIAPDGSRAPVAAITVELTLGEALTRYWAAWMHATRIA
jgi:hypothetical protein